MAKNIVLFSDGTNNQGGNGRDTNVWRLYKLLDHNYSSQIAFYDDGVGTESSTPQKLLGLVFGAGLTRNVLDLYVYLASHYQEEDNVYLFGFSRGAFTIRLLANFIDYIGLPVDPNWKSKPEYLRQWASAAFKDYKQKLKEYDGIYSKKKIHGERRWQIEPLDKSGLPVRELPICCLGVWDTVNATGAPVNEIRTSVFPSWVQDKSIVDLPRCVRTGFHAIAIDESRKTFSPTLWNEKSLEDNQYVEQVWFAGVHANIGGGYPKDGMAQVSLQWMISRIEKLPQLEKNKRKGPRLQFNSKLNQLAAEADVHSKLYNSRSGASAFYRYEPRDITALWQQANGAEAPLVHESVFRRIDNATSFYAPFMIRKIRMVDNETTSLVNIESWPINTRDGKGNNSLSDISHSVKARVFLYWMFLISSFVVILLPIPALISNVPDYDKTDVPSGLISSLISKLGAVLPDMFSHWISWYAHHPWVFLFLVAAFIFQRVLIKKPLERRLSSVASDMWQNLNQALIRQLTGHAAVDVTHDYKNKERNVRELNVVEKYVQKVERSVSNKLNKDRQ